MNAVIYARVSSEKQLEKGLSIQAQIRLCKDYIKKQKLNLLFI